MIKLKVIDEDSNHFMVFADEPFRGEFSTTPDGDVVFHGYRGTDIDMEQRPDLVFLSDNESNEDMEA